jgi:hypothetical protein
VKKSQVVLFERTVDLLKKMHAPNCGVKLRGRKESLELMLAKYEEFRMRGDVEVQEAKLLKASIEAALKVH